LLRYKPEAQAKAEQVNPAHFLLQNCAPGAVGLGRPNGRAGVENEAGKPVNSWNHAAENRCGGLNKSAAKRGRMFAKPGGDGVLAAASFSTRADVSKTNSFQVLKKEALIPPRP
jgi:hypothetical protein